MRERLECGEAQVDTCEGFEPSASPPPSTHPAPRPASPLFKSETFLPGDVAEKFPSPCTRGFSSASEPAAFLNRFCHLSSPSVTPPSRRLELTSQTLKRTSRRFCAKDSRAESVPCFLETVDRTGERMRMWEYRNDFIFP